MFRRTRAPACARLRVSYIKALAPLLGVIGVLVVVVGLVGPTAKAANSSSYLNFQARLLSAAGAVVPDGNYNLQFKVYDAETGGTNLWTETHDYNGGSPDNRVRVVNGYLSVKLGSITSLTSLNWDQEMWLTMNVGGSSTSPSYDGEMLDGGKRIQITALPYSLVSGQIAKTSGSNRGTLSFNTVANNPAITLPDASGTVCLQAASACGFLAGSGNGVQLQASTPGSAQTGHFNISGTGIAGTLQATTSLNSLGKSGFGANASGSDYLISVTADSTSDYSQAIDITQSDDAAEDTYGIAITDTANPGTISSGTRNVRGRYISLTPTATIASNSGASSGLGLIAADQTLNLSNITFANTTGSGGETVNGYGNNVSITGSPVVNDSLGNGDPQTLNVAGFNSSVNITPSIVNNADGITIQTFGGKFSNTSTGSGTASYGSYSSATGAAGTNYGLYAQASGATNNYGVYIQGPSSGSGQYSLYSAGTAQSYFAGDVNTGGNIALQNSGNANATVRKRMAVSGTIADHDVVVLDTSAAGTVTRTTTLSDPKVFGIATGSGTPQDIVIGGTYQVNLDSAAPAIAIGDFLVASTNAGKVTSSASPAAGTVLGRATQARAAGAGGTIWVYVTPGIGGTGGGSSGYSTVQD